MSLKEILIEYKKLEIMNKRNQNQNVCNFKIIFLIKIM